MQNSPLRAIFLSIVASAFLNSLSAFAGNNPTGSSVLSGSATVSQNGTTTTVDVNSSGVSRINWSTFNIANGYTVDFNQLNSSDTVINTVSPNGGSSIINGNLLANGNVWLLNPNGILFGASANINVGGLLAGAGSLTNNGNGTWDFQSSGKSVINQGNITASLNGYVALLGADVENSGTIIANQGSIILAASKDMTINLPLSENISISLNSALNAMGNQAGVKNMGILQARGGQILLQAYVNNLPAGAYAVNTTGIIMADNIGDRQGDVKLTSQSDDNTGGVYASGSITSSNIEINSSNGIDATLANPLDNQNILPWENDPIIISVSPKPITLNVTLGPTISLGSIAYPLTNQITGQFNLGNPNEIRYLLDGPTDLIINPEDTTITLISRTYVWKTSDFYNLFAPNADSPFLSNLNSDPVFYAQESISSLSGMDNNEDQKGGSKKITKRHP